MMFYATLWRGGIRDYMPTVPVLLPASSWSAGKGKGIRNVRVPDHITERAADCGGFVATLKWGDYRYTPAEYVAWLETWGPQWAAMMDYCCEDEITSGKAGIVRDRQDRTTEMAWHFWHTYRDADWAWVPTVQGWTTDDYERHARDLAPLIDEMQQHYGRHSAFRVGIGTLCHRASTAQIIAVAECVTAVLPGVPLHLWGIKLGTFKARAALPSAVVSCDSAAWQGLFAQGRGKQKASGLSQAEYGYRIALPSYLERFDRALSEPKQVSLFGR